MYDPLALERQRIELDRLRLLAKCAGEHPTVRKSRTRRQAR